MARQKTEVVEVVDRTGAVPLPPLPNGLAERYPTGCLSITIDTPPEKWPTSFVVGSREWKAAVVNASCTPDTPVEPQWSDTFHVQNWLVMVREKDDPKTGEISRFRWLALFCSNGDIIGTSSDYAPHGLARALRVYTEEEWQAGVPFRIRARKSKTTGHYYHELRAQS